MPESAIVAAVCRSTARAPEKTAIAGERSHTYTEVERRAAGAAAQISARARGEIVGLLLPNSPAFAWTVLGALWAGKTVAVLPTVAPPPLLRLMAEEAGLKSVLTAAEAAPRVSEAGLEALVLEAGEAGSAPPLASRTHDAAVLLYTSGTTGRPKAVALSDQNILANIEGCCAAAGFTSEEVMLVILPLFHAYGLTVTLLLPLAIGATLVPMERFHPRVTLQAIERHRATALVAVPSQYRLMAKETVPADVSSLRLCIAGAERLAESVGAMFEARFAKSILQGYGATEASPVISLNPPSANRPATVGRPLPNVRLTVRAPEGGPAERVVGARELGEICVTGPSVMLGYHSRPEATAEKIVGGVLRTGDLGFLDEDGYIHLAGRADDLVKVAGEKVYPSEVEEAIERIDGVDEAAVVAVPSEKAGAELCAFVQPKPGAVLTEAGLRAACRDLLESGKIPRRFVVVEQIPRSGSGKLDKRTLLQLATSPP